MSISTEEYLETLYKLTLEGGPASTSAISKSLNIAPASVTEMVQKLAETGYVNYSPYQGVTLTDEGYRIAARMTRKHRILERFLHDILKIDKSKVHHEACGLEHALSDETSCAMCRMLEAPDKCADDGQSIPPCDLSFSSCEECRKCGTAELDKIGRRKENIFSLSSMRDGDEGKISFLRGDSKMLRRLVDMGIKPGMKIRANRRGLPENRVEINSGGWQMIIGEDIAGNVFIEKGDI